MATVTSTRDFKKAVEKVSDYLHKFNGSKNQFTDGSTESAYFANTLVNYAAITTEIAVMQTKTQPKPDLVFSSAVVKLPKENLVVFFRQLLMWNYLASDVAHFALNDKQDAIYLTLRRPVENLDYDEFKDMIEKISATNMNSLLLIRKQFAV